VQHARHKICEAISGTGRFRKVVDTQNKSGTANGYRWGVFAEKREDIYPMVGGKHKKWFVYVMCNVDGEVSEAKFESCVGYNSAIDNDSQWDRAS
jgi:hypothetical protein